MRTQNEIEIANKIAKSCWFFESKPHSWPFSGRGICNEHLIYIVVMKKASIPFDHRKPFGDLNAFETQNSNFCFFWLCKQFSALPLPLPIHEITFVWFFCCHSMISVGFDGVYVNVVWTIGTFIFIPIEFRSKDIHQTICFFTFSRSALKFLHNWKSYNYYLYLYQSLTDWLYFTPLENTLWCISFISIVIFFFVTSFDERFALLIIADVVYCYILQKPESNPKIKIAVQSNCFA